MLSKESFSQEVETFFLDKKCEILEATLIVASKYTMDERIIPKFITPSLRRLIEMEAKRKKLIKIDKDCGDILGL